jgi:GNAT superfamily N-acetyltransferase
VTIIYPRNIGLEVSSKDSITKSHQEKWGGATHKIFHIYNSDNPCHFEEASKICSLFRRSYGNNYHQEFLYHPETIVKRITDGSLVSIVCLFDELQDLAAGEALSNQQNIEYGQRKIAAHLSLSIDDGNLKVSRVLVDPEARGLGLAKLLLEEALVYLAKLKGKSKKRIRGIKTEAVTTHGITQKVFSHFYFKAYGFHFTRYLDYFQTGRRESTMLMKRAFEVLEYRYQKVYIPKKFQSIARYIYSSFSCSREIVSQLDDNKHDENTVRQEDLLEAVHTMPYVIYSSKMSNAKLKISPRVTTASMLARINNVINSEEIKHFTVTFAITTPDSLLWYEELSQRGFIFSALEPDQMGDKVTMQWIKEYADNMKEICDLFGTLDIYGDENKMLLQEFRDLS